MKCTCGGLYIIKFGTHEPSCDFKQFLDYKEEIQLQFKELYKVLKLERLVIPEKEVTYILKKVKKGK